MCVCVCVCVVFLSSSSSSSPPLALLSVQKQSIKSLQNVTKIAPRRGGSVYTKSPGVMNWSKSDREVVGADMNDNDETHEHDAYEVVVPDSCCCCIVGIWLMHWYTTKVPMFDPRNQWRVRWDILLMLFIIMNAICVPVDVAVSLEASLGLTLANNVADTFFLIDILVSFRTGYIIKLYGNDILRDRPLDVGKLKFFFSYSLSFSIIYVLVNLVIFVLNIVLTSLKKNVIYILVKHINISINI